MPRKRPNSTLDSQSNPSAIFDIDGNGSPLDLIAQAKVAREGLATGHSINILSSKLPRFLPGDDVLETSYGRHIILFLLLIVILLLSFTSTGQPPTLPPT